MSRRLNSIAAFALAALVAGGIGAGPAVAAPSHTSAAATAATQADETIINVTDANYDQVMELSKTKAVVLDFYADWCGPCKSMAPYLQKYHDADQGKWIWAKVDLSDHKTNESIANKYSIEYIPTLIDVASGQEKGSRVVGFDTKSGPKDLRTWLNNL